MPTELGATQAGTVKPFINAMRFFSLSPGGSILIASAERLKSAVVDRPGSWRVVNEQVFVAGTVLGTDEIVPKREQMTCQYFSFGRHGGGVL
jgi:hypothetical protein